MVNAETSIGSLIIYKLKTLTKTDKIVWVISHFGFQTTFRGILNFNITYEGEKPILNIHAGSFNVYRITDPELSYLVEAIKEQDESLSREKKVEILSTMLGKEFLQVVLDILGQ